ncbi:MAG: glycosyltransferase [Lachnospiraceae bacterium]|nr:glycosyltransferase [Lachnospiraceae bacterium]
MNIALLNDSFPPLIDGVANTVVNYANVLTKMGEKAIVVTPEYPDTDDSGFPYQVVRYPGVDIRKIAGYIAGIPFSPATQKKLQGFQVEILHSHCPFMSTILARTAAKPLNIPLVMTYHTKFDLDIERIIKMKVVQESILHSLVDNINACDEVWTVSRGAGENLRSIGYEGNYIVMENGVDIPKGRLPEDRVRELTVHPDIPEKVPVFLFVGRLFWYKGIRITLDALAALRSVGYDFRMVFIGKGEEAEEIRKYTGTLRIADKVIFLGPVYDRETLRAWYCRADLFLFPSTFDTNGLVVREAAAASLPSVLVADSCAAEGITTFKNGFLINENASSMAAMLAKIIEHPELLSYVRSRVADDLYVSWEDAIRKAHERYQIVIDNFKSGKYPPHKRPTDEFYKMAGSLVDLIAQYGSKEDPEYE